MAERLVWTYYKEGTRRSAATKHPRNNTTLSNMILIWLILFTTIATSQEVNENSGDMMLNTTTLYPVTNKTLDSIKNLKLKETFEKTLEKEVKADVYTSKEVTGKEVEDKDDTVDVTPVKKEKVATWAIDAKYAVPKQDKPEKLKEETFQADEKRQQNEDTDSIDSKEQLSTEKTGSDDKKKEFKPSPHLGSFFDDENLNLLKFTSPGLVGNKPVRDFVSSKDWHMLKYKSPKNTYRDQLDAPYKFDVDHFLTSDNWKQTLDSKPTVESSVRVPAGGLYKHSNPFKKKPNEEADSDGFGLGFNEGGKEIETSNKQRWNPWKKLLSLVTAFLPVGLIISALTPSVVTLQTTDNDPYVNRASRRVGGSLPGAEAVPNISERCRRRLLCELHSEENYVRLGPHSRVTRKHCYRLRCEDPQAVRAALHWLLAHPPSPHPPGAPAND